MRFILRGAATAVTSWPTFAILAYCITAVMVTRLNMAAEDQPRPTGDVLLFAVLSIRVIVSIGLLWWVLLLVPLVNRLTSEYVLLRAGSRTRALGIGVLECVGILATTGIVVLACVVAVAPWNWQQGWVSPDLIDAFGTTNPVFGVLAAAAYAGLGMLGVGVAVLAIALLTGPRTALIVMIGLYLWAFLSAFGVTASLPALDLSRVFVLTLVLLEHAGAWPMLALAIAVTASILWVVARDRGWRIRPRALLTARQAGWAVVALAALFAVATTTVRGAPETDPALGPVDPVRAILAGFFAGEYGSLAVFTAAMLPILLGATVALGPAVAAAEGRYLEEAIRMRGPVGWTLRHLRAAATRCILIGFGIVAVVTLVALARVGWLADIAHAAWPSFAGTLAAQVIVQLLFYVALGAALLWLAPIDVAWTITVGAALVLGYPLIAHLGPANIFAVFSNNPAAIRPTTTWTPTIAAGILALLALATALVAAARRRAPLANLNLTTG